MAHTADVLILTPDQIDQKINRMAHQVYEENFEASSLLLAGIEDRGYELAGILRDKLLQITDKSVEQGRIKLNKQEPLSTPVTLDPPDDPGSQTIILVDDVLNTGRTLFYALSPFLQFPLNKLQTLVLVHRSHNNFPIAPDFKGISLATSLQEHIYVELTGPGKGVYLR